MDPFCRYYGTELTSRHFLAWGIDQRIELAHIQPGKPVQNAYAESFNGRFRDECLNVSWFQNLWDAAARSPLGGCSTTMSGCTVASITARLTSSCSSGVQRRCRLCKLRSSSGRKMAARQKGGHRCLVKSLDRRAGFSCTQHCPGSGSIWELIASS